MAQSIYECLENNFFVHLCSHRWSSLVALVSSKHMIGKHSHTHTHFSLTQKKMYCTPANVTLVQRKWLSRSVRIGFSTLESSNHTFEQNKRLNCPCNGAFSLFPRGLFLPCHRCRCLFCNLLVHMKAKVMWMKRIEESGREGEDERNKKTTEVKHKSRIMMIRLNEMFEC